MFLVGCCLFVFIVVVALGVLVIVFALSKGLIIALGEAALLGVFDVVVVVEGLIVVIALGTHTHCRCCPWCT